jgi:hypothetical protein
MKAPMLGHALALCLSGILAIVPSTSAPGAQSRPPRALPIGSVQVGHLEAGRFRLAADTPMVSEVRRFLERALQISGPRVDLHRLARTALSERYGSRLSEAAAPPHYVWMWVVDHWELVCLGVYTLEIDFGRRGSVAVEITEEMPV